MVSIPFTTLQQCFNTGGKVGWFACTAKAEVAASVPEEKMVSFLKKTYSIAPDDPQAIGHFNREEEYLKIVGLFTWINIITWVVGFFTLLAGVIGVSNIMLIIIKERTRELGIRRALGATPAKIIIQIMQESMVLTLVPGYAGLAAGLAFVELIGIILTKFGGENQMFKNPEVDVSVALTALLILAITGTLAGILPASRAVSIKPVDAIRDE
jgi:putative ABC transport system permease protein